MDCRTGSGFGRSRARGKHVAAPSLAALLALALLAAALILPWAVNTPCRAADTVTLSLPEVRALPAFTGHYGFIKQGEPFPYFEADYTGVPLDTILEEKLNLAPGAAQVVVRGKDGYSATLSLDRVRAVHPNGLKVIIAHSKWGMPLIDDEGPFRLVVPQATAGTHDQGGETNMLMCVKWVKTIEVSPVPAGMAAPAVASVPDGSLVVYGSVTQPAPAPVTTTQPETPAPPAPATVPQEQPAPATASAGPAQQAAGAAGAIERFGGGRGFGLYVGGATIAAFLPKQARVPFLMVLLSSGARQ